MQYPVKLDFKKIALARQATLTDASNAPIAYARQKILKLKEELEVFKDKSKSGLVCTIKANKVIDFRAAYSFIAENIERFCQGKNQCKDQCLSVICKSDA